jgi:hypothetical protein
MPKEVFKRNQNHKNIGEITVTVKKNPEERLKKAFDYAKQYSDRPISKNWSKYEQLDVRPETK